MHSNNGTPAWMWCWKSNLNVKKLRIILLFKRDFIQNNKWLGRAVINAELQKQLAPEQYGSHKDKLVAIQCLNKRLLHDYACFIHKPLAICSNDTKSCFMVVLGGFYWWDRKMAVVQHVESNCGCPGYWYMLFVLFLGYDLECDHDSWWG